MGHTWKQLPALLAGAGLLAATLHLVGLPARDHRGQAPPPPPAQARLQIGALLARPGIPDNLPVWTRPSEALVRAVERAARGAVPEPYFSDRTEAVRFLDRWQGHLIEGRARVALADQVDAGAANGHRVPVALWLDDDSQVMGLSGEAVFESTPGGLKLRALPLERVPLAVSTWAEAARRVGQANPSGAIAVRATETPFYGLFRFVQAERRYAVSALTGEVVRE